MKSDEELKKAFSIKLQDNGLIVYTVTEGQKERIDSTRQAELVRDVFTKIKEENPGQKFNILVNLVPMGNLPYISNDATRIYTDLMKWDEIKKLAFIASSKTVKVLTGILTQFSNNWAHIRWFNDENAALQWLQQEDDVK